VQAVRKGIALTLAVAGLALLAPPASANFHLMSIRELATNPTGPDSSFIELQMYSSGQNFVNTHTVNFYTDSGGVLASFALTADVANGANQSRILVGDTGTTVTPDFTYPMFGDAVSFSGPGGAACFDNIDCVAWGNFNNTSGTPLPSPTGTPAAAIPNGSSLNRTIAPGCATLLEAGDDTNDSATDFSLGTPSPNNNTNPPTETACGGGGGDTNPPQTQITKQPKAKTTKTTAKFKFSSSETGSSFMCKLDKSAFKSCKSPKKYKHLDLGKHKFQVVATDAAGNTDASPAKAKFKIVEG
jgi:hypothetical protein